MSCPVCGSDQKKTLLVVDSTEAAQQFVIHEGDPERHKMLSGHIRQLWGRSTCEVQECIGCGFGYSDPYVAGDATFYNLAYERINYPADKWDFRRTLQDLAETGFTGRRGLEAGSGFGFFLDMIADKYIPRSGITAMEFHDSAIQTLRSKGYQAVAGDIRKEQLTPGYDAIFLFQVLEHMDHLDELFSQVARLLKSGGILYLTVPNSVLTGFHEENDSLQDMPPNHIGRWNERALGLISARWGLELQKFDREPQRLLPYMRQDIVWSFLRRAKRPGTLENFARQWRSHSFGRLVQAATAVAVAPRRLGVWKKAASRRDLGASVWARIAKTA